jgi:hypothetical protein
MFCDVLAVHDSETECEATAPLPVSVSVVVEGCALLVKVSVALTAPAAVGLKVIVKFVLNPAPSDTGSVGEAKANNLVDTDAPLIVTVVFPALVTARVRLLLVLGLTLPKSRLALARTRVPTCCPDPEPDWLNP